MEPGSETIFHSTPCDSFLAAAAFRRGQGDPGGGGRKAAGLAPQAYGPFTAALWGADGWPGCLSLLPCRAAASGSPGPQLLPFPLGWFWGLALASLGQLPGGLPPSVAPSAPPAWVPQLDGSPETFAPRPFRGHHVGSVGVTVFVQSPHRRRIRKK